MGFASLVAVFVARGPKGLPDRARAGLRSLIDYGLFALFACGLPFALNAFVPSETELWALASGLIVAYTIAYIAFSHRFYKEVYVLNMEDKSWFPRIIVLGDMVTLLVLLGNAVGWPYATRFEIYLIASVFWFLLGAAVSFRGVVAMIWTGDPDE